MFDDIVLKHIDDEQPKVDERVLIVSRDKSDGFRAYYGQWNRGTIDECYSWVNDQYDTVAEIDEYPYWTRRIRKIQ